MPNELIVLVLVVHLLAGFIGLAMTVKARGAPRTFWQVIGAIILVLAGIFSLFVVQRDYAEWKQRQRVQQAH